jgi:mono/diheme cytochrome c family protein
MKTYRSRVRLSLPEVGPHEDYAAVVYRVKDAMVRVLWGVLIVVLVLGAGPWVSGVGSNCCGARQAPSPTETAVARLVRAWSLRSGASQRKNRLVSSAELVQGASRHFADHCASCHANDGSGNTELGRNLFPRAPDMRLAATQQLSDGELYDIIQNGVRWTGMPAWGETGDDPDSWKLVLFVRHLPQQTAEELKQMERFNPRSAAEREEEQQEEDFLNDAPAGDATPKKR